MKQFSFRWGNGLVLTPLGCGNQRFLSTVIKQGPKKLAEHFPQIFSALAAACGQTHF
jgi:hypothetical protein